MEQNECGLIEEFAKIHPIYTSKILEFISIQDLLYVLQNIKLEVSAKILEKMSPKTSLDLISKFSEENQSKILNLIKPYNLISILRFVTKSELEFYLKKISYLERAKVELQLKYEQDEVGAWMNADVPQVNSDHSILDVKKYLDEHYKNERFKEVYVVNNQGLFEGIINLDKILLANDNIKAGSLARVMKYILSPRVKIEVAQNHTGFKKYERLPVVSRDNKILGVFSYVDLKKGLTYGQVTGVNFDEETAEGYGIYGDTLLSLLNIK